MKTIPNTIPYHITVINHNVNTINIYLFLGRIKRTINYVLDRISNLNWWLRSEILQWAFRFEGICEWANEWMNRIVKYTQLSWWPVGFWISWIMLNMLMDYDCIYFSLSSAIHDRVMTIKSNASVKPLVLYLVVRSKPAKISCLYNLFHSIFFL